MGESKNQLISWDMGLSKEWLGYPRSIAIFNGNDDLILVEHDAGGSCCNSPGDWSAEDWQLQLFFADQFMS